MMFLENDLRNASKDYIDLIPGIAASYANLYMILDDDKIENLVKDLNSAKSSNERYKTLKKYSVGRLDPKFWEYQDWFSSKSYNEISNESGVLDLNRYLNI